MDWGCSGQEAEVTASAAKGPDLGEVREAVSEGRCRGAGGILSSAPGEARVGVVRAGVRFTISLSQQVGAMSLKL